MTLRVLTFSPDGDLAGSERAWMLLTEGLRERGVELTLVCPGPGPLANLLHEQGLAVTLAPPWPAGVSRRRAPIRFLRWRKAQVALLRETIEAVDPQVVHVNSSGGALAAVLARKESARSLPVVAHMRHLYQHRRACLGFPSVDRIVAVSSAVRTSLPEAWQNRCTVIHDGVVLPASVPDRRLPDGPLKVAMVGRVAPDKGCDVLLDALDLLEVPWRASITVDEASDPAMEAYRRDIERRAAGMEGVRLLPWTDTVGELLADHHVAVVPSRREGFGLTAVEAMAVGTPVVASRIGGLAETVVDRSTGFLVDPEDPAALAWALSRLAGDGELWSRLSREAVERSRRYSVEAAVEAFAELLVRSGLNP